ncbi:tetratricopeptide repeat protein [Rubrivivax gelatinosus]|uniref:Tetratricopeptide repeat protein n=1 Tax=Rubrivivax gelatinosus TaxID=28068 RepID=A0A4R2M5Y9_RUBGE|nr:tetratricopeptide repeat protein [Rubrivivax gelatinosus]TCO99716.1 tetratricopeptide repeat protein [Rubrivivax gelatinosus]
MTNPPSSPAAPRQPSGALADAVLGAALAAHRDGTLGELLRRRPRATRWVVRRLLQPVLDCGGDALRGVQGEVLALQWLLAWAVAQLRPDGQPGFDAIEREAWLERTSWRPMLAVMCHHGFAPVRAFPDRFRARPDESPADHLCGLWSVGPSTYYRYLDKGRRQLAELLLAPTCERLLSLRDAMQGRAWALLGLDDPVARREWHRAQAGRALVEPAPVAALWHLLQAGDAAGFLQALQRFRVALGHGTLADALAERLAALPLAARQRAELCLAQAALARIRGQEERERLAYEQAQRIASAADDPLMLGVVCGELGKFFEPRDVERAFACYQDSAEFLRRAGVADDPGQAAHREGLQAYVSTLVRLGWLHVLRNDARSKAVLERADALRAALDDGALAQLEQAWGEYRRRDGDLRAALEHKHRALNLYERLGDTQAVVKTWCNLALLYGDAKDYARAIDYSQRVLTLAERSPVEPETVASTHLNLGGTWFWQERWDEAIEQYGAGLAKAEAARLHVLAGRAHYNLAEAFYKRFQRHGRDDDERRGDVHAAAAQLVWAREGDPGAVAATRGLKAEILGPREGGHVDRLLPGEWAAHLGEMVEVERERARLALPLPPEQHVRAHLAIARAYLAIAAQEREAALALVERHGLGGGFVAELDALRATFDRTLTREQRLAARWREHAAALLDDTRRAALLDRLLDAGFVGKSAYAELCGVSLATASKHLGLLTQRGLLEQTGKGPSTRYLLPDAG